MKFLERRLLLAGAAVVAVTPGSYAIAQDAVSELIVTGAADRQLLLDVKTATGSRLGLTARETPAIVDILSERQMQEIGARTSIEALNRAPGVTASNLATSPGQLSLRGFTGGTGISLLYDGARTGNSTVFTRNLDSWGFERIEILKGPASVLYGEGALAGAINLVPKRPILGQFAARGLASVASFGGIRGAGDVNLPLGETSATRLVASYGRSDGYVDDAASELFGATLSYRFEPTDRFSINLAADYFHDDYDTAYMGTPLVPLAVARDPSGLVTSSDGAVIDRALRKRNFNVEDAVTDSDTLWLRSRLRYEFNDAWTFTNELSAYDSDRRFINAEFFTFQPASGLIDRTTGVVSHDIQYFVERPMLSGEGQIAGRRNRFSVGGEYSQLQFGTHRRFGSTSSVDPYGEARGRFPIGDTAANFPSRTYSEAQVDVVSLFGEDAFNLTDRLLLVAGARYDKIDFDRVIDDRNSGARTRIEREYDDVSWRIGAVFEAREGTQLFVQYNQAVTPIGTLVLLSLANSRFDLSKGRSVEAGLKTTFWNGRVDATLAAYHIEQDDIITRSPDNPTLSVQGGTQSARGVELSVSAALTPQLRVDGNYTALDARFDELIEAGGLDRSGNTPPNVPERVANLFAFYSFESLPVSLSGGLRHEGRFFTNNANSIRVRGYTAFDAAVSWRFKSAELTLRGRNLTNVFYADPASPASNQLTLAPPRSVDLTLTKSF